MINYRENDSKAHIFSRPGVFTGLTPPLVTHWAEQALSVPMDGTLEIYNSYVNRVFGLKDENGNRWIMKWYRPGRWTLDAIEEEHDFLFAAEEAEIPVVTPVINSEGFSLHLAHIETQTFAYACFPLKAGRTFEPLGPDDYHRLGSLIARVHCLENRITLNHRNHWEPEDVRKKTLEFFPKATIGELAQELEQILTLGFDRIKLLYRAIQPKMIPIHGDIHRSNILERDGLLLFDFDDAMVGPAVQDLWMLTPDRYDQSLAEWQWIQEGYSQFRPFPTKELSLIESFRFMRMVYHLAWQSIQSQDKNFIERFPQWGTKGFWLKEIEDLWDQYGYLEES
jgi:Ser/Thr protein kinase RdoA (MazF antagonist)